MRGLQGGFFFAVVICFAGCSTYVKHLTSGPAVHSEERVYSHAVDYTYLTALDAIAGHPYWELYFNDKSSGKISVIDSRYMNVTNPDDRIVTILFKAIRRDQTSVTLEKESSGRLNAIELLNLIDAKLVEADRTEHVLKTSPPQAAA